MTKTAYLLLLILTCSCSEIQRFDQSYLLDHMGIPTGNQNQANKSYPPQVQSPAQSVVTEPKRIPQTFVSTPPVKTEPLPKTTHLDIKSLDLGGFYALIIGNNRYQQLPKLETAEHDATEMGKVLSNQYGFKTKLLLNATRTDIMHALTYYRKKMQHNDSLLIFYAGHGHLDEMADEGYWLPVDADAEDPTNWLSVASIASSIKAITARHVIIIADSCFSGKLTRGAGITYIKDSGYYQRLALKRSRTTLVSGGLEPVSDGGGQNNHSVFTSALLNILKSNNSLLDGSTLFTKIRRPVILNADQTPEYGDVRKAGHEGGDFLFVPIN